MATFSINAFVSDNKLKAIASCHYGVWELLQQFDVLPKYEGIPATLTSKHIFKVKEALDFVNFIQHSCETPNASFDIWFHVKLYPQDYIKILHALIETLPNTDLVLLEN